MVDPTGHIALLKKLQDRLEGLQKELIDTTEDLTNFVQQKTGIRDFTIDQKIADVTGTMAGLVGVASDAVGSANLAANLWLAPSAGDSALRREAREELAASIQSIERTAKVVTENPTGVAYHLVDSGARKGLAALQGDPRAMAEVTAVGTQVAVDLVIGSKGSTMAAGVARRSAGMVDDLGNAVLRQTDDLAEGVLRSSSGGGSLPSTGVPRFDERIAGSPQYERWVANLENRGFSVTTASLREGDAATIVGRNVTVDPEQFRYADMLHESRHVRQIERAPQDLDLTGRRTLPIVEKGAYEYEMRLGRKVGFSEEYQSWLRKRVNDYWPPALHKEFSKSPSFRQLFNELWR